MGLILVLAVVVVFAVVQSRNVSATPAPSTEAPMESGYPEKWQEGIITYKDKQYKFNSDIRTYLFLGIDKETPDTPVNGTATGGQSDAMFLLVMNEAEKSLSIISIHRNTMTPVELFGESGTSLGKVKAQICTQHSFGDGKRLSGSRTVEAVEYLFRNLPIDGYISVTMGAMPIVNDAVGGVEVTVSEEIVNASAGVHLKAGETVTLQGAEAYYYLRSRDIDAFDSATNRLRRQEQYIVGLMAKLKEAAKAGTSNVLQIYESIEEHMVTNVDMITFISELEAYEYNKENLFTVPGKTVMGEKFEEYHVDEDALYELIIQVFYEEVFVSSAIQQSTQSVSVTRTPVRTS